MLSFMKTFMKKFTWLSLKDTNTHPTSSILYIDTSLLTYKKDKDFLALVIYVDDILLTGNNLNLIKHIKKQLDEAFSIKDLGNLNYYLGIEFLRNAKGITMTQRKYAMELLQSAEVLDLKPSYIPVDPIEKLNDKDGDLLTDPSQYKALVGKLLYLTITRPYLSYAAHCLSQFSHSPRTPHLKALIKILRYIKLCPGQGSCLTSWQSKKQGVVSRSSTEAEYRALADCTCEITWLLSLLKDLQVSSTLPIPIFCDNPSSISLAANPVQHARTKHKRKNQSRSTPPILHLHY
ncbi:uncharacterized mitochondrial protein-like protein [Tanacetum coccineum]